MSDEQFYWCSSHERVERGEDRCAERNLLGPYESAEAARNWKQQRDAREDRWEAQDEAWEGE
ncbi:hypothetical protein BH23ACT10_BH23ACT10_00990 [soil metagenome]